MAIATQGCKLNQADSEVLARRFAGAGYRVVEANQGPQVFVLNTCTVTGTADSKARRALRSARRANPQALVVATGCYAQRAPEDLTALDAVSLVIGNFQKDDLVAMVSNALAGKPKPAGPEAQALERLVPKTRPNRQKGFRIRANVKIQEGCDQVCAYCIVPKVRGRERSIPVAELVEQINRYGDEGYQEVVLTGTQLGTYGFDLPQTSLAKMLRRILDETTVPRVRVSSLQAQEITPELLDLWDTAPQRLCPHFHIPLQSGSDSVLKAMRRRYDTRTFAATVELVRRRIPDAGITTDLIVGFPGEDETSFQASLDFASAMAFSDMHVFPYSPRPGTSAARYPNSVAAETKKDRAAQMLAAAKRGFQDFRNGQIGNTRPVLWENQGDRDGVRRWSGLTDNYIRVYGRSSRDLTNVICQARLLNGDGDDPYAEVD
ncbi:MAG: tRNA (N(6)-L-threonylcarbamoyladenosine(37)-C(2))-methylthiotransferase MtaB [SAR202 cluster bacterium Io17-Chloro-G2]|nr:MAG: tRNA (N(6)-L-threonylcarbamoyladenosine(37)-C(2))-methylthiotransferase MtaB [SAR202 cluster bacterium Io17-Chloro-G2]